MIAPGCRNRPVYILIARIKLFGLLKEFLLALLVSRCQVDDIKGEAAARPRRRA